MSEITLEILKAVWYRAQEIGWDYRHLKWHVWEPGIKIALMTYDPSKGVGEFTFDKHMNLTEVMGTPVVIYPRFARGEIINDVMLENTITEDYLVWNEQQQIPVKY